MREQQSKLIKLAAEIVNGSKLPSDLVDDYPQKTYSAARVAQMMEPARDRLREIGIELRSIADSLSNGRIVGDAYNDLENRVRRLEGRLSSCR